MVTANIFQHQGIAPGFDFKTYLEDSLRNPFSLNLANAPLMTVIDQYIRVKIKANPDCRANYSSLIKGLETVEKTYNTVLYPIQITEIFWQMFVGIQQERGLAVSSILTISTQLRSILRWSSRYGVTLSPSFDIIRIPKSNTKQIALSADDVSRIYHFDIDRFYADRRPQYRAKMKRVRDMFVLSCNLYQRHSDMVRMNGSCFDRNIFRIMQVKTGSVATVNIDKYAIEPKVVYEILERYGHMPPYIADISNYNKSIEQLMKDVGFTEKVRFEEHVPTGVKEVLVPKYKLISSHTARRTAITLAIQRGCTMHEIKKCSGHSSLDMVERYVKD